MALRTLRPLPVVRARSTMVVATKEAGWSSSRAHSAVALGFLNLALVAWEVAPAQQQPSRVAGPPSSRARSAGRNLSLELRDSPSKRSVYSP